MAAAAGAGARDHEQGHETDSSPSRSPFGRPTPLLDEQLLVNKFGSLAGNIRDAAQKLASMSGSGHAVSDVESLSKEIEAMVEGNGGKMGETRHRGVQLNCGGQVIHLNTRTLRHPSLKNTFLSTLLLKFIDMLPKDESKIAYLEVAPAYFSWLAAEMLLIESGHQHTITLDAPEADDPSVSEYHTLSLHPESRLIGRLAARRRVHTTSSRGSSGSLLQEAQA
ncbi:unnamed protein product [Vitrella brassicaformis CCMP3155]|uniref:Uncharacterized protein n=1 Tax=Vitrella brassicaformis (strain CCMP3155) TaxID=1169540 RepID=A0A0G4FNQ0_VITBC|nr:unnamed protein product [Vitrella brassicaformis CCMP3155]|eukprot:CEM15851.1 unnamed protein product [Vitrella brassicaformis CCMP3155]